MKKHNPENERIKRLYFTFLKEAKRQSEVSVDAVAKALSRFEEYNKYQDFKKFHFQQAIAFKNYLALQRNIQSGQKLSKSTLNSTLGHLKRFIQWLSGQTGYKSRIKYTDAEYFNLSEKETRIAKASKPRNVPTLEQITYVLANMSTSTDIELRNRALFAFALLTGARDNAIASLKLKHIDLTRNCIYQDAREVRTKFSKTFTTYFFPVDRDIRLIVEEWVNYLRDKLLWGNDDPLFPATEVKIGDDRQFHAQGLKRQHWSNANPIRAIFREAFTAVGLPYFNPHSFRNTLVSLGERICKTPEDFKAWSQNLGHEHVLTTFYSYGEVSQQRQSDIILGLSSDESNDLVNNDVKSLAKALAEELRTNP